jgi:predicted dehydrogenase
MTVTPALRFGLFGTGYWAAQTHAAALSGAPEARLVGVWGRDPGKTAAVAATYGIAAYEDADALLSDVDAVSIAVPPQVQVPLAIRAARSGRHLLLEKPVALSAADADELLAAVTGSGVASVVFFTNRFVPAVEQVLRDAIAAGGWHGARGTVLFSVFGDGSPYAESAWRRTWGGLWDLGPHVLSLVLPVLGSATHVTAVQGPHQTSYALVRHEGGAVTAMTLSLDVPRASSELDIAFLGEEGAVRLPVASADPVAALARAAAELSRAAAGLSGGHACDVRFGWEVSAVLSAAAESAVTGRTVPVQFSPSAFSSRSARRPRPAQAPARPGT